MPIRRVQQQSDRGSIRDLANGDDEKFPPTPLEIRLKGLYEHALVTKDQALMNSLGLIPINGAPNDPISIFRHREYINSLSSQLAEKIQEASKEIEGCLSADESFLPQEMKWANYKQKRAQSIITQEGEFIKVGEIDGQVHHKLARSFRRTSQ